MKTNLTPEQSQRLIELGVDPKLASESTKVFEPIDANHRWESEVPIFTLSDILSLLPKEMYSEERDIFYRLNIEMGNFSSSVCYKHYGYTQTFGPTKTAPELIYALFELLVWCITNKHLKL